MDGRTLFLFSVILFSVLRTEYTDINLQARRQMYDGTRTAHTTIVMQKINHTSSGKQRKLSSIMSTIAIGILPDFT